MSRATGSLAATAKTVFERRPAMCRAAPLPATGSRPVNEGIAKPIPHPTRLRPAPNRRQPRPTNGIWVAMTVIVATFASNGRLVM
jgi:hypothetical protein